MFKPVTKLQFPEYPTGFWGSKSFIPKRSLVSIKVILNYPYLLCLWPMNVHQIAQTFGIVNAFALGGNFFT